ncbi:MAG: hypothetical protein AVDCRST_MAG28-3470, partial [uncultured Rubrobacteraceae bacterium]
GRAFGLGPEPLDPRGRKPFDVRYLGARPPRRGAHLHLRGGSQRRLRGGTPAMGGAGRGGNPRHTRRLRPPAPRPGRRTDGPSPAEGTGARAPRLPGRDLASCGQLGGRLRFAAARGCV